MSHFKRLALAISIAAASESGLAFELEEIVVTARHRAESLQDVPLSETAFTASQIEDAKIDSAGDFIAMTPNVTLAESQSAGVSFMTIRGVTQVRNGEPPVATVVDGVLQINSRQFTQELFDVEQIEVLRGPQGALYGRNATGGAILITTKQPTNETEGYVRVGLGKGDETRVQGSVSGALVEDALMYRLAASYVDRDGYLDNDFLGTEVDPYEDTTIRGLLKWHVSENLTADLRVNLGRTESGAINFQYQPALFDPGQPCFTNNALAFAGTSDADSVSRDFCANNEGEGERDIDETSLKLEYLAGAVSLTSITSWNKVEEYTGGDQFPYTAATGIFGVFDGTQTQYAEIEAWSQEFRITSIDDSALRWMLGAYYLETERFISTTTGIDNRQGITRIERRPAFTDAENPTLSFLADDNDNTAWAVFGSLNYDITENLEAAFALRYDQDERRQRVSEHNTSGLPGVENKEEFDKWQPKLTLRYRINEDMQVYGSWGEGFRSGQFNQNGVGVAAAGAGLIGVGDVVDQEETETLEVGFKSEFADNSIRLNGSIYHTKVDGQQYFVFVGEVGAQVLVNIDEVEISGGELELLAHLSDNFNVYAGIGYTDSEVTEYGLNPSAEGNEAPYVPKSTFNIGGQYRFAITDSLNGLVRLDYEHRGGQYWDPENSSKRSSLSLVNARIGVESVEDTWSLVASVKNATDEEYNSEWVLGGFAHPAPPRIWNLDFRYNF
jgi:iron complex outermembrane receptor protein